LSQQTLILEWFGKALKNRNYIRAGVKKTEMDKKKKGKAKESLSLKKPMCSVYAKRGW